MRYCDEKLGKIKSMHTSNFIFWILGKFLLGLGVGILLPMYFFNFGWIIAGWMLIAFAIILMIPAMIAAYGKRSKVPTKLK
ncbi:MAG: hypothetical protein JSW41_00020 [Candidatus Aenigmatarchaeota archaeon]|nr:MAG: hypothetical protein JSW41_00020 [Candidatus Aenigmarchaeota archaeon]